MPSAVGDVCGPLTGAATNDPNAAPATAINLSDGPRLQLVTPTANGTDFVRLQSSATVRAVDPDATTNLGDGITLTWGIVPDGTGVGIATETSDLIEFFDSIYGAG
ncbi:MAG: hypothetical protein AAF745_12755, partial [Planctomycetota bacterium]